METAGKRGGFFVSFEGPEGSGKSTQIHRLAASLAEQGHTVWTTREPGGTRAGEMIRPILLGPQAGPLSAWSEALLFTAARAQLVDEVIRPRLQRGELVLCDRYSDSTLAYQADATGGLTPDLTLLLDLPVEAGLARIPRQAKDRLDRETIAFHQRVYAGYHEMAAREPHRWRQVDASRDADVVASRILELVLEALRTAGIRPAERRSA